MYLKHSEKTAVYISSKDDQKRPSFKVTLTRTHLQNFVDEPGHRL